METALPLLTQILFVALSAICTGFLGMFLSRFFIPPNSGLAGGAQVLGYGIVGLLIGLVASLVLLRFLTSTDIRIANIVLGVITVVFVFYVILRSQQQQRTSDETPPVPKQERKS